MIPRVVVFGGSGFLGSDVLDSTDIGSHICRAATRRGVDVTSISRNEPKRHMEGVHWQKGDIFQPEGYREILKNATGVIYSAGILLEGDYKSLAQGNFDPRKLAKLVQERVKGKNPLEADPKNPSGYDKINRDGGICFSRKLMKRFWLPRKQ